VASSHALRDLGRKAVRINSQLPLDVVYGGSENQFSHADTGLRQVLSNFMLSPRQVLDTYYLEARRDLLEIAALLDRYDAAVERERSSAEDKATLEILRRALAQLAESPGSSGTRTAELLKLFAEI